MIMQVYILFDFVHCYQLCSWHCFRLAPLHLFLLYNSDRSSCFKMFIVLQPNLILNLHCLDLSWMFTRWCQIDIQYYKYVLSNEWKCFITLGALIWRFSGRNVLFGLNKQYLVAYNQILQMGSYKSYYRVCHSIAI